MLMLFLSEEWDQIRERLSGAGDSSDDLQFEFSDFEIREAKKRRLILQEQILEERNGLTPMIQAIVNNSTPADIVPSMLVANDVDKFEVEKNCCANPNKFGELPLHYAACCRIDGHNLIQLIIEKFPQAVNMRDSVRGLTPLEMLEDRMKVLSRNVMKREKRARITKNFLLLKRKTQEYGPDSQMRICFKLCVNSMLYYRSLLPHQVPNEDITLPSSRRINGTGEEFVYKVIVECKLGGWGQFAEDVLSYLGFEKREEEGMLVEMVVGEEKNVDEGEGKEEGKGGEEPHGYDKPSYSLSRSSSHSQFFATAA
ncbi:hypothetical protein TL16_g01825 [Triparma laevis f. inornata]|uniref:Uncharacterized protein n=1 Tax=Triparma laevis f. inornata TaxID=1714386 RepID=A0A9W7DSY4_9STRA|nr:hypothetical protein TL16_g01825 [Triparma laevis f. inornata]